MPVNPAKDYSLMINPMPANPERSCYADLLSWPQEERWELIDGVAHAMTPALSFAHQSIISKLNTQFDTFLEGQPCMVVPALVGVLPGLRIDLARVFREVTSR
jgi:hypothetical protein